MDRRLLVLSVLTGIGMVFLSFPHGALSVLITIVIAIPAILLIRNHTDEKDFLVNAFVMALLVRIGLGLLIYVLDLKELFGPDAITYNDLGQRQAEIWWGLPVPNDLRTYKVNNPFASGWGMNYLVGSIYFLFGPSFLTAQTFCAVIGALTSPLSYFCAKEIFNNKRVAKLSALSIALFPSFVVWSSQLLKDGLLMFLLVAVMLVLLQLQKRVSIQAVLILLMALFGIYALRFYLFYMVAVAVVGSFFVGAASSAQTIVRNLIIVIMLGIALTYLGVIRGASSNLEQFGTLERIQISREDLSRSADSGFGEDVDVSTPTGALAAVPIGLIYLYFAPFPWQIGKMSQVLVLPETFLWWLLLPNLIIGLRYTLKNKFRVALPILLFSLMLTALYSIFQGNVGMLYRQRTQIQVFLFMFIAVGWTMFLEQQENKKFRLEMREEGLRKQLRERREQIEAEQLQVEIKN